VILCKVIGQAVSTVKDKRLEGHRMLIVGRIESDPNVVMDQFVALDSVGAGEGEVVGVIQGAPAQKAFQSEGIPIDAAVIAIFDTLRIEGRDIYKK
jgi:ethanolamine utilization protein EutN